MEFKPKDIVRHFKGNMYEIICIASHTETGEKMMVYKSRDDYEKIWVRPLEMFLSDVDHEKYPDVKREKRFELVSRVWKD